MTVWCLVILFLSTSSFHSDNLNWLVASRQIEPIECLQNKTLCRHRYPVENHLSVDWNTTSVLGPNDMSDTEFAETSCHCDRECSLYGDCCLDATAKYWTATDLNPGLWTCTPVQRRSIRPLHETLAIYTIGQCPLDGRDISDDVSALCQDRMNSTSHLVDIPVLSLDTNRTYANIYCAQCHSDAGRLANWNITYHCSAAKSYKFNISLEQIIQPANYQPDRKQWKDSSIRHSPVVCHLIIEQLQNVAKYIKTTGARRCFPSIEKCAADWAHPSDNQKCHAYTLYVADNSSNIYKNPDCARCNNLPDNEIDCFSVNQTAHKDKIPSRSKSFSFSGIMDFSFGGSDRVGLDKKCGANEIFDHLYDRCHAIICGVNYINQDGICHPIKRIQAEPENFIGWLNSSCPRLSLFQGIDYIRLDNDSLIVNKTGQLLQPEEYEPDLDGQNVTICIDESIQADFFKYSDGQKYLSDICLAVSLAGLVFHIIIHIILPKLCNLPGKNLLSLSCTLLIAQLLFLTAIERKEELGYDLCMAVGILIHWSYLSTFFWMNVMGFDVWRTFCGFQIRHGIAGHGRQSIYWYYSLYAWGFPLLIVLLALLLDVTHLLDNYAPQYGAHLCWICNKRGLGIFFILPVLLLILSNSVLFVLTVRSIWQQRRAAQFALEKNQTYNIHSASMPASVHRNKHQIRFILYVKLGLIMGMGWILGFVAGLADLPDLWYPFIILNALQGAYIFLMFDCKLKIYYMLYKWATSRPHPADNSFAGSRERAIVTMGNSQRTTTTIYNVDRTD